jgi:hypothetical protein
LGLLLAFAGLIVSWSGKTVLAQSEKPTEYQVKAAFIYNFAKFAEWPSEAFQDDSAPVLVGVLGEDPFGDTLEQTIQGKTVNGRNLLIRRSHQIHDLKGCHVLFISSSEQKRLPRILETVRGSGVLTVGESEHFTKLGGAIRLLLEDNKVRFEINLDAAMRSRVKISSKLLAVAKVFREETAKKKG